MTAASVRGSVDIAVEVTDPGNGSGPAQRLSARMLSIVVPIDTVAWRVGRCSA